MFEPVPYSEQTPPNTIEEQSASSNAGVASSIEVHLPEFDEQDPELWLPIIESTFSLKRITSSITKYLHVIGRLTTNKMKIFHSTTKPLPLISDMPMPLFYRIRIVSYNILADLYCDSDYTRQVLHPYCPPHALDINYRKQLIIEEIAGFHSDIICLQEVDWKVFNYDLDPFLSKLNYASNFTRKGGQVAEGVACFYHLDKFQLMTVNNILLAEELPTNEIFAEMWTAVSANDKLKERFIERQTVLQITVLECRENGKILIVANTHLYFQADADHIRLLQGAMCIKYIESIYKNIQEQHPNKSTTVIFCGDFNSTPDCGVYSLFTTGSVDKDAKDWSSNKEEQVTNLCLEQPFQLASACGTPKYTNYTVGFADCLDYIYFDSQQMEVSQSVPMPSNDELILNTALPSVVFPSDHISLCSDLRWK